MTAWVAEPGDARVVSYMRQREDATAKSLARIEARAAAEAAKYAGAVAALPSVTATSLRKPEM